MGSGVVIQGSIFECLRYPRYRRLLAALGTSQLGDWIYNFALLALVYERTHSTAWVAATTTARVVPMLALGPIGGVVADRWERRRVMIACDLVRAVLMTGLVAVALLDLPIVLVPLIAAVATAASGPHPACVAAATPHLVDKAVLTQANAAAGAIHQLCIVVGPALGAALLLASGPVTAFAVNAGSFVVAAILTASVPTGPAFRPAGARRRRRAIVADVRSAAAAIARSRTASALLAADVVCSAIYGAHTVLLLLVGQRVADGQNGFGYLLAAFGVGGVLGSAAVGRATAHFDTGRVVIAALLAVATTTALLPLATSLPAALMLVMAGGAGTLVCEALAMTGVQRSVGDDILARAAGFLVPASIAGILAGSLLAAPLNAVVGLAGAYVIFGCATALFAVWLVRGPTLTTPR